MPSLADRSIQQIYANRIVNLYRNFAKQTPGQREAEFEFAMLAVARAAGLHSPTLVWRKAEGCQFLYSDWTLELSKKATILKPHGNFQEWVSEASSLYHEMRHCEQHFRLIQAMLTGAVSIPRHGKRSVHNHDTIFFRTLILHANRYPPMIVDRANHTKTELPQQQIPLLRAIAEDRFGRGERENTHNFHARRHGKDLAKAYLDYYHKRAEMDAFVIEQQVTQLICEGLKQKPIMNTSLEHQKLLEGPGQAALDRAYEGFGRMFRERHPPVVVGRW